MLKLLYFIFILIFTAVYFVPAFVAIARKHTYVLQITILNLFLGWSFIAWVAALIWATTKHTDENVSTKGSWIMIGVIFVLLLSPLLIYGIIPAKYKSSIMQETEYKKVIYNSGSGNVINEVTETKKIKED